MNQTIQPLTIEEIELVSGGGFDIDPVAATDAGGAEDYPEIINEPPP